ncbi:BREX-2 system adenine-specific DNA-methyltransferase PglX [Actinomarinicola tropica]|uniref:site-specific DNA-methyltransferase (adenine-specific) n=1 Tax=Actinomarinicola tropica TaxID=2789776 RepID=A0A5Q2RFE9_9ACTN|nr:BREX-2 system adenine-specific DNA-methyltransferase PglX [Actinomarinicola tropica]QGG94364.1 BREX-2 system adenine-specific DNA-methyltransferase PglX [Actinomarinicola tropica]
MIETRRLTDDLRAEVVRLVEDLRERADTVDEVAEVVHREWSAAHEAGRTAHDEETWREGLLTQVAVGWVLGCVFVRFCEDNRLWPVTYLSGPGDRRRHAIEEQHAFFRGRPEAGERAWLLHVFAEAATQPGLDQVLNDHNPLWRFGPSDDACRRLLEVWREIDPETGDLVRDFTDPQVGTRFLGDLYQDLSEHAKKTYALLQTPEFVEEFILDHTLDPAIEEFGLQRFRMIDPACGSGHFLLGGFQRLFERWMDRAPQDGARANAAKALDAVFGVDLNPFAAAIARFRLLVAGLQAAEVRTLAEAPRFRLNVAVGDSLLHGTPPRQQTLGIEEDDPATRHLFETEDRELIGRFLGQKYHAVVANPPYITPKDPALNASYRLRYATCHMKYSLSVPFMERLFDLAVRGSSTEPAGFVGQITANSFMKREFGRKVIEEFLAHEVDLTHVIDTSGAYIPGHGTPTVILFGRNRSPVGSSVRAVLGIRGEPGRPAEAAKGYVWRSIVDHLAESGVETDFVSVVDFPRQRLVRHPWSLQGGGADDLRSHLEAGGRVLDKVVTSVGITSFTLEDDVYLVPENLALRRGLTPARPMVEGELLRDWGSRKGNASLFPYGETLKPLGNALPLPSYRHLWPFRTGLSSNKMFGNKTKVEAGLHWTEFGRLTADKLRSPLSIAFAFVATHNHFVLDRGGKVFNRSAPVIKLTAGATERDHLELLGPLNSAVGCFWMKQVFFPKGGDQVGNEGARVRKTWWDERYEFDGTKLKRFPLPDGSALAWASRLDQLSQELAALTPSAAAESGVPTRERFAENRQRAMEVRREMVAVQEELDWRCAFLYGLTTEDLSLPPDDPFLTDRGQRAFEIVLARKLVAGEAESTWFTRHGTTPITDLPTDWPDDYRALVERRIELINSDRYVGLVERPEYKRRWNWDDWDEMERDALRTWLLDRLEEPRYWPQAKPRTAAQLADDARSDADFVSVAQLYAGIDVDLTDLIVELTTPEAVPYLAAWRYTPSGLRKLAAWERTWDLQRREDAGEDVGTIPVPPKYAKSDFRSGSYWTLRGKLDVPKERFISYPGAERGSDPTPVLGWAGWNHLDAATALAAWYTERRSVDGWDADALAPLLAGLAELVPWLQQWHNDLDPATGQALGDFFADFVTTETHGLGLRASDLTDWRPPERPRGRRRRSTTT